ncbi:MAG: ABC transporter permease [Steroidobacteraceae bacterium]|jgi:peptide/nickel transport system permease protein|nr:ABC transporter permease [Steroidobacteraceae bacterium]
MSAAVTWRRVALLVLVATFVLAPALSPHDPAEQFRDHASRPPSCGSPCFPLGTDELGRDVLSRTLHGGQLSLSAGVGAASLAVLLGGLLGALAGAARRWLDLALSRVVDLLLALPWIYLLIGVRAALPLSVPSDRAYLLTMALLGVLGIGAPFRQARQAVRAARASEPVHAARGLGASERYLLTQHLLPAAVPGLAALWLMLVPGFVLAEVALSFLGLGIGEPAVSWGTVLAQLRDYPVLVSQWWMFAPVLALVAFLALLPVRGWSHDPGWLARRARLPATDRGTHAAPAS